jgi:HAE1 family hydrophobic/amphiphilic exporter-1
MPTPPSFRKVNPADFADFLHRHELADAAHLSVVNEYAETQLAQRLSTLPGVAQVQCLRFAEVAVRIQADPDQLSSRGIGIDELQAGAAKNSNVNQPLGSSTVRGRVSRCRPTGSCSTADAYRRLTVAWRNGAPVKLEELARVVDGVENTKVASLVQRPAHHHAGVFRQPGSNTIETVSAIRKVLPAFQANLPARSTCRCTTTAACRSANPSTTCSSR